MIKKNKASKVHSWFDESLNYFKEDVMANSKSEYPELDSYFSNNFEKLLNEFKEHMTKLLNDFTSKKAEMDASLSKKADQCKEIARVLEENIKEFIPAYDSKGDSKWKVFMNIFKYSLGSKE